MTSRPAGVDGPVSRAGRFDLGIARFCILRSTILFDYSAADP